MSRGYKSTEVSVVSAGWLLAGSAMKFMVCLLTSTLRSAAVATLSWDEVFEAASIECIPTGRWSNDKDLKNTETLLPAMRSILRRSCVGSWWLNSRSSMSSPIYSSSLVPNATRRRCLIITYSPAAGGLFTMSATCANAAMSNSPMNLWNSDVSLLILYYQNCTFARANHNASCVCQNGESLRSTMMHIWPRARLRLRPWSFLFRKSWWVTSAGVSPRVCFSL